MRGSSEVRTLREELPQQAVGVLVHATLPGMVQPGEVHVQTKLPLQSRLRRRSGTDVSPVKIAFFRGEWVMQRTWAEPACLRQGRQAPMLHSGDNATDSPLQDREGGELLSVE